MIDGEYYIIYDDVQNVDNFGINEYANQLHFALYPHSDPDGLSYDGSSGIFNYVHSDNNLHLYGTMGCLNPNYTIADYDSLPQGQLRWDNTKEWEHKRLWIKSRNAINEKFLTLLIPSESTTDFVREVINGDGYYGVRFDDENLLDDKQMYAGVLNDTISSLTFTEQPQVLIETDADFFLIETDHGFGEVKKFIVNHGDSLRAQNSHLVYSGYSSIEEVIAEYGCDLNVTFKTDYNVCPTYEILRCGVAPENLYSKTEFGSYHPGTNPSTRGTIENNIWSLAYDADYFYVNYTLSELQSEGLLDDVVIYSGDFTNAFTGISTDVTFGTGSITFSGGMIIPSGVTVTFLASAQPKFTANGYISVNGSLVAQGSVDNPVVFTAESTQWSGIAVNSGGSLNFNYTEISKADNAILCYGAITLTNSTVHLCENGVTLQSTTSPIIQNNQLFDCTSYGLKLSSVTLSLGCPIRNNEIYQNGIGVILYNSTYSLSENDIHNNTTHALHASSKSSSTISNSFLGLTDGTNPEIYLLDSYPVLNHQHNDIIFDFGTQNSYSIYNASSRLRSYSCGDNYWGTTNTSIIAESFYPSSWPVTYSPLSSSANTSYRESTVEDLLLLAITNENQGNYLEAESIFKSIVSTYPDSLESLQSLGHLLNCNTSGSQGFEDLRQYYLTIAQDTLHSDISHYAEDYAILCNRRLQMFDEALRDYEYQLSNPLNYVDSLFTEIDIVQTIQEANASNVGRYALSRSELQRVQKREQELFGLLTREFKPANGTPNPSVPFKLHSAYPNPFNPTTTISYSIPAAAAVELSIYNVKGQKVVTLVNQHQEAGEYATPWNGTDSENNPVASGVYFYRLSDDHGNNKVQKCLLLK